MEPSIFTRIVRGEIPAHKIYEDDKTLAFLDIHAPLKGYTLVISKTQIDRAEDLTDEDYDALMKTVKKVMKRQVEVYGREYRPCLKTLGFDVPHVHIHVVPCKSGEDFFAMPSPDIEPDHDALAAEAKKLAF